MTLQVDIRAAIITLVNSDFVAAFPGTPIVYDNAPFDWNNPPESFVVFEIDYQGGEQIGISGLPKRRVFGLVYVTVYAREGTGSKTANALVDWFSTKLGFARADPVTFKEPAPAGSQVVRGYYTEQLKVDFFSDPA